MAHFKELNKDIQSLTNENVIQAFSTFCLKALKRREESYKSMQDLLDVDQIKANIAKAKRETRVRDKRKNTFLKSSRQTRGLPRQFDETLDAPGDIDSEVSVRSTRRAAQVANMKNKDVLSGNLNQKIRRPTNFGEVSTTTRQKRSQLEVMSPVPPAKYRRMRNEQSPGNVDASEATGNNFKSVDLFGSTQTIILDTDNKDNSDERATECNITTTKGAYKPEKKIPTYVDKNSTTYKQLTTTTVVRIEIHKTNKLCASSDSGISEGGNIQLENSNNVNIVKEKILPHTATVDSSTDFQTEATTNHFRTKRIKKNDGHKENDKVDQEEVEKESTNTKFRTKLIKKNDARKENDKVDQEEVEEESANTKFRTKLIKKNDAHKENEKVDQEEVEEESANTKFRTKLIKKNDERKENHKVDQEESTNTKFRTKLIKKNDEHKVDQEEVEEESTNTKLRTKVIKKNDKVDQEEVDAESTDTRNEHNKLGERRDASSVTTKKPDLFDEDYDVPPSSRTKTKAANKHDLVIHKQNFENEPSPIRKRDKVNKKATEEDIFAEDNDPFDETNEPINKKIPNNLVKDVTNLPEYTANKANNKHITSNVPELPKSELVKKRVEEYEKVHVFPDKTLEKTGGRVTRTKTRAMAAATSVVDLTDSAVVVEELYQKDVLEECGKENLPSNVASIQHGDEKSVNEKVRGTPLADYNRVATPNIGSKSVCKTNTADKRAILKVDNKAFVHKLTTSDIKMKQKEEIVVKKKKQADEATKKKEKTLKATADQARRKREEKLQKAAAAREAAEKEKAALAMKHEKEQEEKARQILLEKEKMKEEMAKKKIIFQQKLHEAEERRNQEEAARIAKIKEQEEEQKRLQANREKELEAAERLNQKRQLEELRAKEAEKIKKAQNLKLHKVAMANAKMKKEGKTEASTHTCTTYEITPDRDQRQVLKPKSEHDYGIDDAHTDDSSDDEQKPKKKIPLWAQGVQRKIHLSKLKWLSNAGNLFMECDLNPDLKAVFSQRQLPERNKPRTSSAIWTAPLLH